MLGCRRSKKSYWWCPAQKEKNSALYNRLFQPCYKRIINFPLRPAILVTMDLTYHSLPIFFSYSKFIVVPMAEGPLPLALNHAYACYLHRHIAHGRELYVRSYVCLTNNCNGSMHAHAAVTFVTGTHGALQYVRTLLAASITTTTQLQSSVEISPSLSNQ